MKILYTTHQFLPEYFSGTEILTYSTAREMRRRGHEVSILTGFPPKGETGQTQLSDRYEYRGLKIDRFFCSQSPHWIRNRIESEYHDPSFSHYFLERLREIKPDIVHFYHLQRLSAEAIRFCVKSRIPTVFTACDFWALCPTNQLLYQNGSICDGPGEKAENCIRHLAALSQGPHLQTLLEKVPGPTLRFLIQCIKNPLLPKTKHTSFIQSILIRQAKMKKVFSQVDRILVATDFMKKKLCSFGLEANRISKLTFGIEDNNDPSSFSEKGIGKKLTIGFIGTFYFHKGADILLRAIRLTPEDLPICVKLYGSLEQFPGYSNLLKTIAKGDRRVEFCGTFPKDHIRKIFDHLDLLVVPSRWHENSPLVIHSAQAAHVPVLGSNAVGINEIIQNNSNGFLFERGDAKALSEIIQRLCHDRTIFKRLSKNIQKPKSIVSYGDDLIQVYSDVLNHGRHVAYKFS